MFRINKLKDGKIVFLMYETFGKYFIQLHYELNNDEEQYMITSNIYRDIIDYNVNVELILEIVCEKLRDWITDKNLLYLIPKLFLVITNYLL